MAVNSGFLFGSQGIINAARAFYAFVLAYFLGPVAYGQFSYGMSWYLLFLPAACLGLDVVIGREIGKRSSEGQPIVSQTLTVRLIASFCIASLSIVLVFLAETTAQQTTLLLLFTLALPGRSLATWADAVFIAYQSSRHVFQQTTVFRLLEVCIGLSILYFGGGILSLALVHAFSWWLHALSSVGRLRRDFVAVLPGPAWLSLRRYLPMGILLGISGIAYGGLLQGPILALRFLGDNPADLGALSLALQVLMVLVGIPLAIGTAALPLLSRSHEQQGRSDATYLEGLLRIGFVLACGAGLSGAFFGPALVEWIFGARYAITGELLGPTLWVLGPATWLTAGMHVLFAHGRIGIALLGAAVGALVMLVAAVVLLPIFGTLSMIVAMGLGMTVAAVLIIFHLQRATRFRMTVAVFRPVLLVVVTLLVHLWIPSAWPSFLFGMLVLFAGTLGVVVREDERAGIKLWYFQRRYS